MIRFELRARVPLWLVLAVPLGAGSVALLLALGLLGLTGAPVGPAAGLLVQGAAGSLFALSETLTRATPLLFTGLAAALAFRARLWNIGAEGQFYAGALASVVVGTGAFDLPSLLQVPLVLLAGALGGAAVLLVPVLLKARLQVDEVVTTLLLNFVVLLFVQMMLEGPLKDPMGMGWPQSEPMLDEAILPTLLPPTRLHAGLPLGIVLAVLVALLLGRTVLGFEIRAVGGNAPAARFAGIRVGRTLLLTGLLSGGLAGLGGAVEVAGLKHYLTADLSPGFGYAGIVVAMLAGLDPIAVVPAALFIAGVFVGADSMSRTLGVSSYFADLVVALALLAMLTGSLLLRFRLRRVRRA